MDSLKFNCFYTCDLPCDINIKICSLEGVCKKPKLKEILENPILKYIDPHEPGRCDLFVYCQLYSSGVSMGPVVQTKYKAFEKRWEWNEWVTLPLQFCDLPRDAILTFTVLACNGPGRIDPIGWTGVSLFGKDGVFREGMEDLRILDGQPDIERIQLLEVNPPQDSSELDRLAYLEKQYQHRLMNRVDWLDRLTFREIALIREKGKRMSQNMYLTVQFPKLPTDDGMLSSLMFFEKGGEKQSSYSTCGKVVKIPDPEIYLENLVEQKHQALARSTRSDRTDRDLKPNAESRDKLLAITNYPPSQQLTNFDQDLVWKYRFFLSSQKKGLTKFLKCVNWESDDQSKKALELLHKWVPPDVDDALEFLGPGFSHPEVRGYAVERLSHASDEDLLLFLLQLVQALKYERWDKNAMNFDDLHYSSWKEESYSCDSFSKYSKDNMDSMDVSSSVGTTDADGHKLVEPTHVDEEALVGSGKKTIEVTEEDISTPSDLMSFLIGCATKNSVLCSYLYWYLLVECKEHEIPGQLDVKMHEMYTYAMEKLNVTLQHSHLETYIDLKKQQNFMDHLMRLIQTISNEGGIRPFREEKLQKMLVEYKDFNFVSFDPLPLPLDPEVEVCGIIPENAILFKSALEPCKLTFRTVTGDEYIAIFKYGDDLRQDQLVIQMITLMDRLLRRDNFDLRLTPYKVLATSSKCGFVQYVDSIPVAEVLRTEGTIANFFKRIAPDDTSKTGVAVDVMENYVKSCAGYCVMTYILGIGDRHFDNLLLTRSGNLIHIDFGYMLGRDPKPLPPPMKLSKEMVEPMAEIYGEFRRLCFTTFLQLRTHANLIVNLFSLMVDASIPDIALEPDKTVKKVEDKFRLDLTDEQAANYFQYLLDESVNTVFGAVVEHFHKIAQYMRK